MEWKLCVLASLLSVALLSRTHGVQLSNQSTCPPWMTVNQDGLCQCNPAYSRLQKSFIRNIYCDRETMITYVASGICLTKANGSQNIMEDYVIGDCPYTPVHQQNYFNGFLRQLPENVSDLESSMCGPFNRHGFLCSECKPGYGIAVYSIGYPCVKCTGYRGLFTFLFILLELVPITVFFVIVVMVRIRATAPPLAGLVFFSHVILIVSRFRILFYTSMTSSVPHISIMWYIAISFSSIWGLEFFRFWAPLFCIDPHLSNIEAVLLEYISAFYPMVLVLVTYTMIELHSRNVRFLVWMWRPFNKLFAQFRRSWDIRYSIVNAFSTFLLLSYSKIIIVSFRFLYQTSIYDINGRRIASGLHIDPTTRSFSSPAQSFICITAISVIIVFSVLPLLILLLYPTSLFQKLLRRCTFRAKHALVMFVDTYQGCLKDGSDGTRDYRIVSTLYLILRLSLLSFYTKESASVTNGLSFIIYALLFNAIGIFVLKFQPYKEEKMNVSEFFILMIQGNVTLFSYIWITYTQESYAAVISVLILLPHCIVAGYFVYYKLVRHKVKRWSSWMKTRFVLPRKVTNARITSYLLRSFNPNYSTSVSNHDTELPDRFINPQNYTTDANTISAKNTNITYNNFPTP